MLTTRIACPVRFPRNMPEGERWGNVKKIVCDYIQEMIRLCMEPLVRHRGANHSATLARRLALLKSPGNACQGSGSC